jgi:ribosomal protein L21E
MTSKASENDGYRYAVSGVDIFSKYGWAMPIKTKQPHDVLTGLKEVLDKIGIPEILYSDSEGSFNSTVFVRFINSKKIKHIFTNSHAHFIEAFNKTIKQQIHTRLEAKGEDIDKWTLELFNVIRKYNRTPHRTTELPPEEARQDKNRLTVFMNIALKAKHNRRYPPLKLGSLVRILLKPSTFKKSWHDRWSAETYKIIAIQGRYYLVNDNKRKVMLRHEMLLVDYHTE